jgi:hypothetical protein
MDLLLATGTKRLWFARLLRPLVFSCPVQGEYALLLVLVSDAVTVEEQAELSEQFVRSGCRYAVCFGPTSSSWDDSIDMVGEMDGVDGRPSRFVMTTWHDHEPIEDTVRLFAEQAHFDDWSTDDYVVVLLGGTDADERKVREVVRRGFC